MNSWRSTFGNVIEIFGVFEKMKTFVKNHKDVTSYTLYASPSVACWGLEEGRGVHFNYNGVLSRESKR